MVTCCGCCIIVLQLRLLVFLSLWWQLHIRCFLHQGKIHGEFSPLQWVSFIILQMLRTFTFPLAAYAIPLKQKMTVTTWGNFCHPKHHPLSWIFSLGSRCSNLVMMSAYQEWSRIYQDSHTSPRHVLKIWMFANILFNSWSCTWRTRRRSSTIAPPELMCFPFWCLRFLSGANGSYACLCKPVEVKEKSVLSFVPF